MPETKMTAREALRALVEALGATLAAARVDRAVAWTRLEQAKYHAKEVLARPAA